MRRDAPLAVVLGASVNGLSFVRSLGRRGVPTLLLDGTRRVGMATRFGRTRELPPLEHEPQAWLDLLGHLAERTPAPPVVFATSDAHTVFLARHASKLRDHHRFLVPDPATLATIVDKRRQYDAAADVGVPLPAVSCPRSAAEVEDVARRIAYPCILKPCDADAGRPRLGGRKVVVAPTADALVATWRRVATPDVPFLVQEIVPGPDSELYGYLAFWDAGREVAWVTKRKLRQHPPHFGDGSLQVTVDAPEVAALARRLLGALGYSGFVGVEFKRDPRDGAFKLMEINPRTVSGNQIAIAAGVDLPWIGYRTLVDGAVPAAAVRPFEPGVLYMNEEWDFKTWLILRRSRTLTLARWLRDWRRTRAHALWAWDDPGPLLEVLGRFARAGARRVSG